MKKNNEDGVVTTKIPVLFELMKARGINSTQLSEAIGVSTGNISDWKKGRSSPSMEKLAKLSQFFDVSVDYLVGRENPEDFLMMYRFRTLTKGLSEEEQKNALRILEESLGVTKKNEGAE